MSDPAHGEQAARCRASRCCRCLALKLRERGRVVGHHEPPIGRDHATRDRAELDRDTVPLCTGCHTERHDKGEHTFWSTAGVDWQHVRARMREGAIWTEFEVIPY